MPTPPPSPQRRRVFQAAERLMLVITSEIGTGATGVVHGGILEVELPNQSVSSTLLRNLHSPTTKKNGRLMKTQFTVT
jgi:hypothetical protein